MQNLPRIRRTYFHTISAAEIAHYIHKDLAFILAGGKQIEGIGMSLLESIDGGDPDAGDGISLIDVCVILLACGLHIL